MHAMAEVLPSYCDDAIQTLGLGILQCVRRVTNDGCTC